MSNDKSITPPDQTIPSRPGSSRPAAKLTRQSWQPPDRNTIEKIVRALQPDLKDHISASAPWMLQQYFDGEIDLDNELRQRFPNMPLFSVSYFRSLSDRYAMATLTTQDAASSLIFQMDAQTLVLECSFIYGSMISLGFQLNNLSELDRSSWLELMQSDEKGLAFLWGERRWESDYLVSVKHRYFTHLYAFSPHHSEGAVRITNDVMTKLLNWVERYWSAPPPQPPAENLSASW
jgi:hypothetical protein